MDLDRSRPVTDSQKPMNSTGLPLSSTFIHLPGMGELRERALWRRGILDWGQFVEAVATNKLPRQTYRNVVPSVHESRSALERRDVGFFTARLPDCEMWRLYPEFAEEMLFLDVETTGFGAAFNYVTLVATACSRQLALFVDGVNLGDLPSHVDQHSFLVTFNGSQFDLPFLQSHFPKAQFDKPHIDLRFLLASLGYEGGLKGTEHAIGLRRDPLLRGITGQDAPRLWQRYRSGDESALEVLALHNLTDAVHLTELLAFAVSEKTKRLEFPGQMVMRQASLLSCREYLSEWFAKHARRDSPAAGESSLTLRTAVGSGSV